MNKKKYILIGFIVIMIIFVFIIGFEVGSQLAMKACVDIIMEMKK